MAKKKVAKRKPHTEVAPPPVYGPPLGKRLAFKNGDKNSFSYVSYEPLSTVDVIPEALDLMGKPAPHYGTFLVTEKIQTDGGGQWILTFKTTFNAGTNTTLKKPSNSKAGDTSPLGAGKLRITIKPVTQKATDIYWTYPNVTYS